MIFCINHLHREATYNIPKDFCDVCWEIWYTENYFKDDSNIDNLVTIRQEDLKQTWIERGSPGHELEKEMLKEIAELTKKERDDVNE